jgi:hypothetical protein
MANIAVLINSSVHPKVLFTKADLGEYHGMFLCGSDDENTMLKGRYSSDYKHMIDIITKSSKMMIHMAPGGGLVPKIFK